VKFINFPQDNRPINRQSPADYHFR